MKSCDYLVWEKLVVFCVMGLIIIQGGFFEDSYLLIGGCIAFLMLSDREKFCGDIKFTFGLGVVSFLCILYHSIIERKFISGYILCFLIIYFLSVQRKDLLKNGVFCGVIAMEAIGMLAYVGIDIGGIIRNNRFMGTFQYANTTAVILVFTIIYLRENNNEFYYRFQILNYIFLFLTCSVGGIISYILAVAYCMIGNKDTIKVWLKEIMVVLISLLAAVIIYWISFVVKANFFNLIIFMIAVIVSYNCEKILDKIIEHIKHIEVIMTVIGIILVCVTVVSVKIIVSGRAIKTFEERIWQMQDGLNVLKNNLLTGAGSYGWKNNLIKWSTHNYKVNIIHNSYLHIGVKYGIIILFMLIFLTIYLIYCSRMWNKCYQAILYIGILHAFFDIDFFFMGYCSCILIYISEKERKQSKFTIKNNIFYKNTFLSLTGIVLIVKWLFVLVKK